MGMFEYETDLAPPKPKTQIEVRRWWNQITINALSSGRLTGCEEDTIICSHFRFTDQHSKRLPCVKCNHCTDMHLRPESAFIGFRFE